MSLRVNTWELVMGKAASKGRFRAAVPVVYMLFVVESRGTIWQRHQAGFSGQTRLEPDLQAISTYQGNKGHEA